MIDCVQDHRVYVYDRGGQNRIGELTRMSRVKWTRIRDDISECEVDITAENCGANADLLGQMEPGRHELVIYRGEDRVWEGPLNRATYHRNGVEFYCKDVMLYAFRTIMHAGYNNAYPNIGYVTSRAKQILVAELARKEALTPPINVVSHIVEHHYAEDAKTSRVTKPYEMTVFEHIDDLAARAGMDYTVVGRAIHLWDNNRPIGYTAQATDSDFLGDLYVSVYGTELATHSAVVASDGTYAVAGAIDPFYGEWERLTTAADEGKDTDAAPPSLAELQSQAIRNLGGRRPTPVDVRIPDNSSLNQSGVLRITDLVPGVYVPLVASQTARQVSQMQKIQVVTVTETPEGHDITLTLIPAAREDVPEEGTTDG